MIKMWENKNPWLGLGSYKEGQIIYGRDKEISVIKEIIVNNKATVIYGKSGIGKSSIINAGVSPLLRDNGYCPIYIRLEHNTEISYIKQIEDAVKERITIIDKLQAKIPDLGLWDFFHRNDFYDGNNKKISPIVILDQFEEIYTLTDLKHKVCVSELFSELADVLNNVKPDKIIDTQAKFLSQKKSIIEKSTGFVLQQQSVSALKYNEDSDFKIVICLRDDSLYLLERNSAKIPSLKNNRYNLTALEENDALDVILKPLPGLFTEAEGEAIVKKLSYYEQEGGRVVDPAILSLFLYIYYKEKGNVAYDDIFAGYYNESMLSIARKTVHYLEDNLLTDNGYRCQIPLAEVLSFGVSVSEINNLLGAIILKTEKRNGLDYIEFSHDRLCSEALKHRSERKIQESQRKMRKNLIVAGLIVFLSIGMSVLLGSLWIENVAQNQNLENKNRELDLAFNELDKKNKYLNQTQDSLKAFIDSIKNLNASVLSQEKMNKYKDVKLKEAEDSISYWRKSFNMALAKQKITDDNDNIDDFKIESVSTPKDRNVQTQTDVQLVYEACKDIRVSLLCGDYQKLSFAGGVLRTKTTPFKSLFSLKSENRSLDNHLVFDYVFIDSILAGKKDSAYKNAAQYEKKRKTGVIFGVNTKTCVVGSLATETYRFFSNGFQEVAIVTEPQGKINVKIYDRTKNEVIYEFISKRDIYVPLKNNSKTEIGLEVENESDKAISFVIISN